jgi:hypothetical protein
MKTVRIREKIKEFLGDRPRNTAEILEHINSTMRHGTTSQQLGNVLLKDKDIVKVGYIKGSGILSGGYDICEWATRIWVEDNCPGWEVGKPLLIDRSFVETVDERHYAYTFSDEDNPFFGFLENLPSYWSIDLFQSFESSILSIEDKSRRFSELQRYFNQYSEFKDIPKQMVFLIRLGDYLLGGLTGREHTTGSNTDNLQHAIICYSEAINVSKGQRKENDIWAGTSPSNDLVQNTLEPAELIMIAYNNLGLARLLSKEFDMAYGCFEMSRRYLFNMIAANTLPSESSGEKLQNLLNENMELYWRLKTESTSGKLRFDNLGTAQMAKNE